MFRGQLHVGEGMVRALENAHNRIVQTAVGHGAGGALSAAQVVLLSESIAALTRTVVVLVDPNQPSLLPQGVTAASWGNPPTLVLQHGLISLVFYQVDGSYVFCRIDGIP